MKILQFVWFLVLASLLPGFVSDAFGQNEQPPASAMQTDRPDATDSPFVVDKGVMQIEIGWTYKEHGDGSDDESNTLPQTLRRYGLGDNWELRMGWGGYELIEEGDEHSSNISVGLKRYMADQTDTTPAYGLLFEVSLPTGHNSDDVDAGVRYAWDWKIDDSSSVAGNIGLSIPTDMTTDDRFLQGVISLSYSRSLNDKLGWFAEYYTNFPAADEQDAEHVVQTGLTYMVNNDLQFDCFIGGGLNHQADDFMAGVGLSFRF